MMECNGIVQANSKVNAQLQFGEGSTPTWETSSYTYAMAGQNSQFGPEGTGSNAATSILLNVNTIFVTATSTFSVVAYVRNVASTAVVKTVTFQSFYTAANANNYESENGGGEYRGDTNAITALRFQFSSGNITSGQCSLYGLSN